MEIVKMDKRMDPYAEFLEAICKGFAENQPTSAAVVYRAANGDIASGYFGEAKGVQEKAVLSFTIHQDALMDTVLANADRIRERADEIEAEGETHANQ